MKLRPASLGLLLPGAAGCAIMDGGGYMGRRKAPVSSAPGLTGRA